MEGAGNDCEPQGVVQVIEGLRKGGQAGNHHRADESRGHLAPCQRLAMVQKADR